MPAYLSEFSPAAPARRLVVTGVAVAWAIVLSTPSSARAQLALDIPIQIAPPAIPMMACRGQGGLEGPVWAIVLAAMAAEDRKPWRPTVRALEDSLATRAAEKPDDVESQFLYAVALGARTEVESGRTQVAKAEELHGQLQRVLAIDPDHPGAQHLVGRLHAAVMRLGGFKRFIATRLLGGGVLSSASWDNARDHLVEAEVGDPCVPDHHYELAKLYLETGSRAEARDELEHVMFLIAGDARRRGMAGNVANLLGQLGRATDHTPTPNEP